jgi:hypothetical protein
MNCCADIYVLAEVRGFRLQPGRPSDLVPSMALAWVAWRDEELAAERAKTALSKQKFESATPPISVPASPHTIIERLLFAHSEPLSNTTKVFTRFLDNV